MMDNLFELFDHDDGGGICSVKYRRVWLLVDNGYLNWSTTIPPMKQTMFTKKQGGQKSWNQCEKMWSVPLGSWKEDGEYLKLGDTCLGLMK